MFKKFRLRNKNNEEPESLSLYEDDIEQIKILLTTKELPVLILDPNWYKIKQLVVNKNIEALEVKVNEILQRRGQIQVDISDYNKKKQSLIGKILKISEQVQTNIDEAIALTEAKEALIHANDTIALLEVEAQDIEADLDQSNLELVESTVITTYSQMKDCKEESTTLDQEIQNLRNELLQKTSQKKVCDKKYTELYQYLHNIVGYEYVNKMDKIAGAKKDD
ncbi:MAG: hypothetical protein ATN35_13490 [Epulopiscium sp. Nele67-Bin004]|nr:MAG: hypothetical protein ATN35_13490 [Epulopiscium sp. Nele67-Bin004]